MTKIKMFDRGQMQKVHNFLARGKKRSFEDVNVKRKKLFVPIFDYNRLWPAKGRCCRFKIQSQLLQCRSLLGLDAESYRCRLEDGKLFLYLCLRF